MTTTLTNLINQLLQILHILYRNGQTRMENNKLNLYLVVIDWSYYNEKHEPEWYHFIAESYDYDDIKKKAKSFLNETLHLDEDDENIEIDQVWINKVEVKDYKFNITANS